VNAYTGSQHEAAMARPVKTSVGFRRRHQRLCSLPGRGGHSISLAKTREPRTSVRSAPGGPYTAPFEFANRCVRTQELAHQVDHQNAVPLVKRQRLIDLMPDQVPWKGTTEVMYARWT
jgi:hypothetical protein